MIKPIFICSIVVLVAALGLAGCSTLSEQVDVVNIGDTPEKVVSAMGEPKEKREVAGVPGHRSVWVYTAHDQTTLQKTGWSEILSPRVEDQHGTVVQEAVKRPVYRVRASEEVHVNFTDGLVSSLEHRKR